jgi:hypothetical protein
MTADATVGGDRHRERCAASALVGPPLAPAPSPEAALLVTGSRQIVFSSARRAPRRRWTRVGGIVAVVAALVLVAALVVAGSLWAYAWARLGGDQVAGLEGPADALGASTATAAPGATTILVALTEPRDPTVPAAPELRAPVLLVQVGGTREVPAVVAFPEALPISVEGAPTATVAEVQASGDLDGLVAAISDYSGLRIDHVVAASEDALPRLTELQGPERCDGDLCVPLTSAEVRAAQAEGEVEDRVAASTAVLRALASELDLVGALTSPLASKRTIDVVARDVRTDVSLRGTGLVDLARGLEGAPAPEVAVLPMLHNPETGGSVVLLEGTETLLQRMRDGAPLVDDGDATPREADPTELAGTVDVAVLNGAGIDGLAGRVESRLVAEGFRVVGTGNASSFDDGGPTTISYDPADPTAEVAAILLAARLEGAVLQPADRTPMFEGEPVGVVVTVGSDLDDGEG